MFVTGNGGEFWLEPVDEVDVVAIVLSCRLGLISKGGVNDGGEYVSELTESLMAFSLIHW